MKKKLQDKLFKKHPNIFRQKDLPPQQSCMCFGIECGDGWYGIIDFLCKRLRENGGCEAVQVKEKYGGLRFYVNGANNRQYDIISEIECLSYYICEHCGSPFDVAQTKGWISTLCGECRKEKKK